MPRTNYENLPKLDFSIFKNKFASSAKHPSMTGEIEFPKEFLRAMAEQVKRGLTPTCKVASWPREARKTNDPYQFMRLELKVPSDWGNEEIEEEEESDDGLPF
mgnify:FL=1|jgi:hypothetical protein